MRRIIMAAAITVGALALPAQAQAGDPHAEAANRVSVRVFEQQTGDRMLRFRTPNRTRAAGARYWYFTTWITGRRGWHGWVKTRVTHRRPIRVVVRRYQFESRDGSQAVGGPRGASAHVGAPLLPMQIVRGKARARAGGWCHERESLTRGRERCKRGSVEHFGCRRDSLTHPERGWCDSSYAFVLRDPTSPNDGQTFLCWGRSAYVAVWALGGRRRNPRGAILLHKWTRWYTGFDNCQRLGHPARAAHRPVCNNNLSCVKRHYARPDAQRRCMAVNGARWRGCRYVDQPYGTVGAEARRWGLHSYLTAYQFNRADWPGFDDVCRGHVVWNAHTGQTVPGSRVERCS